MSEVVEFPFDSGAYEAADRQWLPANLLAVVENMRLDLDGRLGVRPGNTALATTTYSASALTAYDLANYNGRLVALGDQTGAGRATDLFEKVDGVAVWRATAAEDATSGTGPRMPRATQVRQIGRIPDQASSVLTASICATPNGLIAVAAATSGGRTTFHLFNPVTNQTILLTSRQMSLGRVIMAGSNLWLVGVSSANNIIGFPMNPSTDEQLPTSATALSAIGTTITDLAISSFGASGFAVSMINATVVKVRIYTTTGGAGAAFDATATSSTATGISGNAAGTLLSVAWQATVSNAYQFSTFNAAGVLQTGPTNLFGGSSGSTIDRLGMKQQGAQICFVACADNDSVFAAIGPEFETVTQLCTNQATHAMGVTSTYRNSLPVTLPSYMINGAADEWYFGAVDYFAASSGKGTSQLVERSTRLVQMFIDPLLAAPIPAVATGRNDISGSCTIGTKMYWATILRETDTGNVDQDITTFTVVECEMTDTNPGRRQVAALANELHIAGGLPLIYDGQGLWEHGFTERPVVYGAAGSFIVGGSKTLLGAYFLRAVWEVVDARGNILRSQASDPVAVTLTGANNMISGSATTPHGLRNNTIFQNAGNYTVRVAIYCTIAGGANFFLDKLILIDPTLVDMFAPVAFTLVQSDLALGDNLVLYEQSQTPVSHVAPPPYQYAWRAREREFVAGLPSEEEWTFSKLLFPGEPVEFASPGRLGFSGRSGQRITAVGAFETVGLVWTKAEVTVVPGRGPEHNGTGEFDAAIHVPSPGGCIEWRSVVDAPPGFFFQMAADKLMLVPRSAQSQGGTGGAGAVTWIGQPVRQTLALFPVITGAVHVRSQMVVAFSCTDVAGTSGRILIYDLRREQWFVDTVGPAVAVSELDGRLAFIIAGVVFLQDLAPGSGAMPACAVQTGIQPISKRMGWGSIYKVGLLTLDSGACSVECLIDYDDGAGFRSLGTETYTGTGLYQNRFWSLAIQKTPRYALRFVMTGASGTLGQRMIAWSVEVEGSKNMVRVGAGGNVS